MRDLYFRVSTLFFSGVVQNNQSLACDGGYVRVFDGGGAGQSIANRRTGTNTSTAADTAASDHSLSTARVIAA